MLTSVMDTDVVVVSDDNECTDGTAVCSPHADCMDTEGSYKCTCQPGYSGDGETCSSTYTMSPLYTVHADPVALSSGCHKPLDRCRPVASPST